MEKTEILEKILLENKIKKLNPIQEEALKMGILNGKSLVVSSPTSSGKTILAEMGGLNVAFNNFKKMIYLCPLVALAREKYEDFKTKYSKYGIKVALSVGNFDSGDLWLGKFDWIITSNEKMDSLIRHEAPWISTVGLVVVDEVHLLNDLERGPTLEILLTILKKILPNSQFLAFSATIKNAEEIGNWLGAEVLKSDFRPVPLYKGILIGDQIKMFGKEDYFLRKDLSSEESIVEDTLLRRKQLIFFLSSRRNAEALAEKLSKFVFHFLTDDEIKNLEKISEKVEKFLNTPTYQCKKLSKCLKKGVAFYHSGVLFGQRILIEEAYKKGLIKVITSTTSLAMGVNLPNFRSIVRDIKRYYPGLGAQYLPVLEVEQMFGRSGRPQFDNWGEGILVAKNGDETTELEEYYIQGELEEIFSKISSEAALRMHLLSLIANRFCQTKSSLLDFLENTFFGKKTQEIDYLNSVIEKIISDLNEWGFLEEAEEKLKASPLGKRISQLYIDPLTAKIFIENLKNCEKINEFSLFCLLAKSQELKPSPNFSTKEEILIGQTILDNKEYLFFHFPDEFEEEYKEFLKEAKLALAFSLWIDEKTEKEIMETFKITPGELHSRIEIADWLIYSILEISKIVNFDKKIERLIKIVRLRLKYGIKEELSSLVKLEGIGRVRARALFNAGFKDVNSLKKASLEEIAKILKSKTLAQKIKSQLK